MSDRSVFGQILENISYASDTHIEPNVTGRDLQIAREALLIALPIALRYSLAHSNTFDMMRLLKSLGGGMPVPDFKASEDHAVKAVIQELQQDKKAKVKFNPKAPEKAHPMQELIDEYLEHPEIYMPEKGRF